MYEFNAGLTFTMSLDTYPPRLKAGRNYDLIRGVYKIKLVGHSRRNIGHFPMTSQTMNHTRSPKIRKCLNVMEFLDASHQYTSNEPSTTIR